MGKDYLGKDQRSVRPDDEEQEKPTKALDAGDIALLKTYVCAYAEMCGPCVRVSLPVSTCFFMALFLHVRACLCV